MSTLSIANNKIESRALPVKVKEAPTKPVIQSSLGSVAAPGIIAPLQGQQISTAALPQESAAPAASEKLLFQISGYDYPILEVTLRPGESIKAEKHALVYKDKGIKMKTKMDGGFLKGLVRKFSDENFFFEIFTNNSNQPQKVALKAPVLGSLVPVDLAKLGGKLICQKGAFVCGTKDLAVSSKFTKNFGAGLLGGEGFILQEITGTGLAFINAQGSIITRTLAPGESMEVSTGKIVGFTPEVKYSVTTTGGVKNAILSGEGLFNAKLTGPGTVFVQTIAASSSAPKHESHHRGASFWPRFGLGSALGFGFGFHH